MVTVVGFSSLRLIGVASPRVLGATTFRAVGVGSSTAGGRGVLEITTSSASVEGACSRALVGGATSTAVSSSFASRYSG